jgi:hypothetical protein
MNTNLIGRKCRFNAGKSRFYEIVGLFVEEGCPILIIMDVESGHLDSQHISKMSVLREDA